jgi:hypothetical protein
MAGRGRRVGLADVVEVARSMADAGEVLRSREFHWRLLRWVAVALVFALAVGVLTPHVEAFDHGQMARRFPHLTFCVTVASVYVFGVAGEHLAAAALSMWDPTLRADYFTPRQLLRHGRRVLSRVAALLAFGTSQYAMWLWPVPDQEGAAARAATTAAVTTLVGLWLARRIQRLRAAGLPDRVRELAAALRAERELEHERSGR